MTRVDIIEKAGGKGTIAIPDFRGSGDAQRFMGTFNTTLWNEIEQSGLFRMAPKTSYPLTVPQQPQDWKAAPAPQPAPRRGQPAAMRSLRLRSW